MTPGVASGAAQDHLCITWSPERHYCDVLGPGTSWSFLWEVSWFAVQASHYADALALALHPRHAQPR